MSDHAARFQPYILAILDHHSPGGFSTRKLITFTSPRRRTFFRRFIRRKCRAWRRGDWVLVPGAQLFELAIEWAEDHGSYIYSLPLSKVPSRRRFVEGEDSEGELGGESEEENVPDTELYSEDEHI